MRIVCIIPARWGSTRFPGKPLADVAGEPMIVRAANLAHKAQCFDAVYVATDDDRIANAVGGFAAPIMTSIECRNGTERCAEAAQMLDLDPHDIVVNLQGDAILTPPAWLRMLVNHMRTAPYPVTTCIKPRGAFDSPVPGEVQALVDVEFNALYFTRGPIPQSADGRYQHFGVYAYTVAALRRYVKHEPTRREVAEELEQLRFVENGINVKCLMPLSGDPKREVNYPNDIEPVVEELVKLWSR